jgi:hypothetical protein
MNKLDEIKKAHRQITKTARAMGIRFPTKRERQDEQMRVMGIDPDQVPDNISARSHWNRIDQWDPDAVARWATHWNIDPVTSFIKGNAVNQPDPV